MVACPAFNQAIRSNIPIDQSKTKTKTDSQDAGRVCCPFSYKCIFFGYIVCNELIRKHFSFSLQHVCEGNLLYCWLLRRQCCGSGPFSTGFGGPYFDRFPDQNMINIFKQNMIDIFKQNMINIFKSPHTHTHMTKDRQKAGVLR